MSGAELRDQAIQQKTDNNPLTVQQFLNEIATTRSCRLRMAHTYDQSFTVEELLTDVQRRCRLKADTSLYGAIGRLARTRGYIEETGVWQAANRDSRHNNRSPVCRWTVN